MCDETCKRNTDGHALLRLVEAVEHEKIVGIPKPELMQMTAQKGIFLDMTLYKGVHKGFG